MRPLRFVAPSLRQLDGARSDALVFGVYRDQRPFSGLAGLVDWRLAGRMSRLAARGFLLGDVGELLLMPARPRLPFEQILVAGLGPRHGFDETAFLMTLERMVTSLSGLRITKAVLELPGRGDNAIGVERAAELVFETLDEERLASLAFVEQPRDERRVEAQADRRRRSNARQGPLLR